MRLMTLLVAALLLACGEQFPPELCGPVPDQEVVIGTVTSVPICFQDADGQSITLTATSLNESVVEATVRGHAVALRAVSVGEAVITVVATDSDNMTGEVMFGVTVPNRTPILITRLPSLTLTDDEPSATVELSEYFSDPDEQTLMYEAEVSDTSIIGVELDQGGALTVSLKGTGRGTVQVTATDPGGLSASGSIQVLVSGREVIFTDDFEADLVGWTTDASTLMEIDEGRARLAVTDISAIARAQTLIPIAANWSLRVTVENQTEDLWSTIIIYTGKRSLSALGFFFGGNVQRMGLPAEPATNFVFGVQGNGNDVWQSNPDLWGMHDAIKAPGVAMNVTLTMRDGRVKVVVDNTTILEFFSEDLPSVVQQIAIVGAPPIEQSGSATRYVYFDDIEVDGVKLMETGISERSIMMGSPVIRWRKEN